MKPLKIATLSLTLISLLFFTQCRREKKEPEISDNELNESILKDYGKIVYLNAYSDLANKSAVLDQTINIFISSSTDANLENVKTQWRNTRMVWEKSEAHLFGPVATENIDPRIDAWPVDFIRLDSVMISNASFNENYINGLEESLKGFHPIEYLIFGINGAKKASDFTDRQKQYLQALSLNLKTLTTSLFNDWAESNGNFVNTFSSANNNIYPNKKAAFQEIVNAMVGICDEVANGKIDGVLITLDSTLEESPFSNNSLTDFKNNILGVQESYLGINNGQDGKGLEDFVKRHNLSLDIEIKQRLAVALNSFNNITVPFGQAVHTQPQQVQNTVNAINSLRQVLEDKLIPLVLLHTQ